MAGLEITFNSIYGSFMNGSKQLFLLGTYCDPIPGFGPSSIFREIPAEIPFFRFLIADLLTHMPEKMPEKNPHM